MDEEYTETEEYAAEFTYEDSNKEGFSFPLSDVNNFEEASVKAIQELQTRGIITEDDMVGRIKNPKGKYYEIFRGEWLVNFKTGKKLDSLEEKLGEEQ